MTDQTKRSIDDDINSILLGKVSNKRRATGDANKLRAFKQGGKEDEKCSEYCVPLKVWDILATDYQAAVRQCDKSKIGYVKDNTGKTGVRTSQEYLR